MPQHTHHFKNWPFRAAVDAVTFSTAKVAREGFPVLQVSHDHHGDWQFLDATTDQPGECVLLCLGCVFETDATLAAISDLPPGWSAYRGELGGDWERWERLPEEEDQAVGDDHACAGAEEGEAKALADIAEYGLHVITVLQDGESPSFTYSLGIEQSLGLPELIVMGLKSSVAHAAINECYLQMKSDPSIGTGSRVPGLLGGGFECLIGEVAPERAKQYLCWASWLYKEKGFRACQIIFPTTAGAFPWEPEASDWFRKFQPLLAGAASTPA